MYGERVDPEPVYSVMFPSDDLWGPSDEGTWTVALDLWESYLEAQTRDTTIHHHPRPASEVELRARALEALLAERGLVSTDAIDAVVELYEQTSARRTAPRWWPARGSTTPIETDC